MSFKAADYYRKNRDQGDLNDEDREAFLEIIKKRGEYRAVIDYHSLVMRKVGSSASKSLTELGDKLGNFVEAVLGVVSDDEGKKKSRISFSERFQKRKKR